MKTETNQNTNQGHEANTLLAVIGFDWNQYRSTIWLANAHVNDERFLKPEKIGVLVADIKKLLHIIHEAQEAACASGGEAQSQSEGFYCADWNRCGAICEEQCPACKKADRAELL